MFSHYFDTSALLKLLVHEEESTPLHNFIEEEGLTVPMNAFLEFESKNALEAKKYRSDLSESELSYAFSRYQKNLVNGLFRFIPLSFPDVFVRALRLSEQVTPSTGCRSLDLLHLAVLLETDCAVLVTWDERQAQAAETVGVEVARIAA